MGKKTGLYECHKLAGARFVDFGGWDMPLHYGSQIDEHKAVRSRAGVFDVSHMSVVDFSGDDSREFLAILLANNIDRLEIPGKGLYSCMLNDDGGVIDDLIVYHIGDKSYRAVLNASRREADLNWIQERAIDFKVEISEPQDLCILALQGPQAIKQATALLPLEIQQAALQLPKFGCLHVNEFFISRTGYTGEDGLEIILPSDQAEALWSGLLKIDIQPCGLGARDTLRLEAGLNLYGQDMSEDFSPLECGLTWTVCWDPISREFNGRQALERKKIDGVQSRFVGLFLDQRGIMRSGQRVITSKGDGLITSGGFSPSLQRSIAFARIPICEDVDCKVEIRSKLIPASITETAFLSRKNF
ncbi:MAG: glycine cleavage system aminomethyltransferase GcvT [Pseudomonadota bacterium]|nr:glycine cleavage system aminomethyltransferase GcvT [Pseudomonadota bacterium]